MLSANIIDMSPLATYHDLYVIYCFSRQSQCKVKNDEDAMMAHDVSAELIKRIVEYKANMSAEKHAAAVSLSLNQHLNCQLYFLNRSQFTTKV